MTRNLHCVCVIVNSRWSHDSLAGVITEEDTNTTHHLRVCMTGVILREDNHLDNVLIKVITGDVKALTDLAAARVCGRDNCPVSRIEYY